jgi:hypothetical protein
MSDFPSTRHDMLRANYRKTGDGVCKGCSAPIEWWKTTNGRSIPMNPIANDNVVVEPHWATCPNAKDFKGGDAKAPAEKRSTLGPSPAEELRRLRLKHNARVIVMIDDDLISAANFVRSEIAKKEAKF